MDFNLSAFQEPRGVMRILQFIFSICAFSTITGFEGSFKYRIGNVQESCDYGYPFSKYWDAKINENATKVCELKLDFDYSSDARFFVATGVLAMLYAIAIIIVYAKFDDLYKSNSQLPLIDFVITVFFGVLWLSSSASWANSLTGLKYMPNAVETTCKVDVTASSFSTLNISVILGFLNFFLWASDLWFLYKETAWFQGRPDQTSAPNV